MTCREAGELLHLFFDGEIEGDRMRHVGLHVARCERCRREISELTALQHLLARTLDERVEQVDVARVALAVGERLETMPVPGAARVREWWQELAGRRRSAPLWMGVAAALALFALWWWRGAPIERSLEVAASNNEVEIRSLSSSAPAVAMWSEPHFGTAVIWVADEPPGR
jgi:anti-sigma factor RsiW